MRAGAREGGVAGRRRYHAHLPGALYIAVTLLLALGAFNSQNNLLFGALGLAIGGLLVSGLISGVSLMGLSVEREPVHRAVAGEPLVIRYRVRNSGRIVPAFALNVEEWRRGDRASWRMAVRGGVRAVRRAWKGGLGAAGERRPAASAPARAFVVHIGPRQTVHPSAVILPRRRGVMELSGVRVWSTFPFGLAKKSIAWARPQRIVVHPVRLNLRPGLLKELISVSPAGAGSARMAGGGEEFFGLRHYVPGDSVRGIAWKPTARSEHVVVRQLAMPTPVRLWVLLRLRGGGAPDERAIALAAAILRAATRRGTPVGLAAGDVVHPARTGARHLDRLLTDLALLEAGGARGMRAGGPWLGTVRSTACVVVHAGGIDAAGGPAHARHLSADALGEYLDEGGIGDGGWAKGDGAAVMEGAA